MAELISQLQQQLPKHTQRKCKKKYPSYYHNTPVPPISMLTTGPYKSCEIISTKVSLKPDITTLPVNIEIGGAGVSWFLTTEEFFFRNIRSSRFSKWCKLLSIYRMYRAEVPRGGGGCFLGSTSHLEVGPVIRNGATRGSPRRSRKRCVEWCAC